MTKAHAAIRGALGSANATLTDLEARLREAATEAKAGATVTGKGGWRYLEDAADCCMTALQELLRARANIESAQLRGWSPADE